MISVCISLVISVYFQADMWSTSRKSTATGYCFVLVCSFSKGLILNWTVNYPHVNCLKCNSLSLVNSVVAFEPYLSTWDHWSLQIWLLQFPAWARNTNRVFLCWAQCILLRQYCWGVLWHNVSKSLDWNLLTTDKAK